MSFAASLASLLAIAAQAITVFPGDILVTEDTYQQVLRVNPVTGEQAVVSAGEWLQRPYGIALEAGSRTAVVSSYAYGRIVRIDLATGNQTLLSAGGTLANSYAIAVAADGQIYVADTGVPGVVKVDPVSGGQTIVSSGGVFSLPRGITLSCSGDIYVTDPGANAVVRVDPNIPDNGSGHNQSVIVQGAPFTGLRGLAASAGGILHVADISGVYRVNPEAKTIERILWSGDGLTYPYTADMAGDGNLVVADPAGMAMGSIFSVNPSNGDKRLISTAQLLSDPLDITIVGVSEPNTGSQMSIICSEDIVTSVDGWQCGAEQVLDAPAVKDSCGSVMVTGTRSDNLPLDAAYPVGQTTISWTAVDGSGNLATCQQKITIVNPDPIVTLAGPVSGSLFAVKTPVTFSATFTDAGGGTHTGTWGFDAIEQSATITEPSGAAPGEATALYTFTAAGVYKVKLTVDDSCGGSGMADQIDGMEVLVVVYDPTAGFVTGGGWIDSRPGAYVLDDSLSGKANFGFVSKYEKGANVPTGQTEFQFKVANFNFHSTAYQWLVVAGPKAQYKGVGQVNGAGNYGFLLTATDGDLNGGGGVDKFRIKIWDKNTADAIVYDNVLGESDDIDNANPQAIGGGSIVIHKTK